TWSNDKDIQHWLKTSGLSKLVHCYTDTPHNAINTNTKGKGTCIMINKHLNPHVQSHWEFPDRAVLLQLNIKDKIYLLGSIYVPSNPNTVDQRHETQRLFDFIETTINNLPRTTIIILGGDWNSVLNPMLDRTNNDTSKIPELKQMHKLMRKKFYDPFRHLHSLQQDFTFSHRNKDTIFEARLDYFLVNTRALLAVSECDILKDMLIDTDHKAITLRILLPKRRHQFIDYNRYKISWDMCSAEQIVSFSQSIANDTTLQGIEQKIGHIDTQGNQTQLLMNEYTNTLLYTIRKRAKKHLPYTAPSRKRKVRTKHISIQGIKTLRNILLPIKAKLKRDITLSEDDMASLHS
ncbi:hypothetical protein ROZALSC1DRAFT_25783, partial [Rozella allomycis CSF55]